MLSAKQRKRQRRDPGNNMASLSSHAYQGRVTPVGQHEFVEDGPELGSKGQRISVGKLQRSAPLQWQAALFHHTEALPVRIGLQLEAALVNVHHIITINTVIIATSTRPC